MGNHGHMRPASILVAVSLGACTLIVAPCMGESTSGLEMTPGMAVHYRTELPFKDVVIGKHEVADATVITDRSLALIAKDPGRTTILLFGADRQLVDTLDVNVVPLERGVGRKSVTVRSFEKDYVTHFYSCESAPTAAASPCVFDKTASNRPPIPVFSTPVVTTTPAAEKPK